MIENEINSEIDKICLKIYLSKNNHYLIDLLFDYSINKDTNLVGIVFENLFII